MVEIVVEETKTGGRELTVYGSCPCTFAFEFVQGQDNTLREEDSLHAGCKRENEENIGFAYRQATKHLQGLGFRVIHPRHRERFIR
jgi:hypothetical protein